jgi:hypothetical protein
MENIKSEQQIYIESARERERAKKEKQNCNKNDKYEIKKKIERKKNEKK